MMTLSQEPAALCPTSDRMFAPLMMLSLGSTAYVDSKTGRLIKIAPMMRFRRTLG